MSRLASDTVLDVEVYYIENYQTIKNAYESHYLHYDVEVVTDKQRIQYHTGDYVIIVNQPVNRYIVETLDPQGPDSYFCWNFFDAAIQQKEWYS